MRAERNNLGRQSGVMLLEALIAILIFSIGILAIIGMQALSIQNVSQAKYRTDASFLANDLIGQMWASDRAALSANFSYGGSGTAPAALQPWLDKVTASLPGVAGHMPIITIGDEGGVGSFTANKVTITISYLAPPDTVVHNYESFAFLPYCASSNC